MEKKSIFKRKFGIAVLMTAVVLTMTFFTVIAQNQKAVEVKKVPDVKPLVSAVRDTIGIIVSQIPVTPIRVRITEHPKDFNKPNPGFYPMDVAPFSLNVKAVGKEPISFAWFYRQNYFVPGVPGKIPDSTVRTEWMPVPECTMFSGTMTNTLTIKLGNCDGFEYEFKCLALNSINCVWSNIAKVYVGSPAPR